MKHKVALLGGSGMLGSMVVDWLSRDPAIELTASVRSSELMHRFSGLYPNVRWVEFSFEKATSDHELTVLHDQEWIINAIGVTKPLIRDDDPAQIEQAILVNAVLPHEIGRIAARHGGRVLQIATDCVYSGARGCYSEADFHDALDVYGKTKSLGESFQQDVYHLRCSIIGPEPREHKFLLEWFRKQPQRAQVSGYVNHRWNGITTLHFARLCGGIVRERLQPAHLQHVVPASTVTKAEMLRDFAKAYCRTDIEIREVEAKTVIDRTLTTASPDGNQRLWAAAGYTVPPTVSDMISEMSRHQYRAGEMA